MRIRKRRLLVVILVFAFLLFGGITWIGSLTSADAAAPRPVPAAAPRAAAPAPANAPTADGKAFFEANIRPVLVKQCYGCHSPDAKEPGGGLLLDTRQGIRRGGDDGPAVIPGNVEESLLIKALRYTDKDLQMPPSDKLPDAVIKNFEAWVKMGAPDPRDGSAPLAKTYDTEGAKKWWAFQALKRPATPQLTDASWPRTDIDRHVLAGLEGKGIKPVADADKITLIRRVSFDLIGLPPTQEDIDAFVRDDTPDALAKVVDKLLASPQFGERWGRHWLDVARFAESTGKDVNMTYPDAWRYRDYVIAAFNADKPYDQFIKEQLAGDLLPAPTPQKRAEQLIATGFLAVGPKGLDEKAARQFDLDVADEQVMTTSQAFMGLTVSCARCHDHKFDPILQRDYYGMAGIFLSSKTHFGTLAGPRSDQSSDLIELPAAASEPTPFNKMTPDQRANLTKQLATATSDLDDLLASRGRGRGRAQQPGLPQEIQQAQGQQAHLQAQLDAFDASGKPKALAMGVEDRPPAPGGRVAAMGPPDTRRGVMVKQVTGFETIADSPLFFRGEMSDPRERVPRGIPAFLAPAGGSVVVPANESGRRQLANWIASPRNPLTARVMANRMWLWLTGQGIVPTVDNFGTMGEAPSNQPLLDYLAGRLIDNHWSVKKTIREIVLSRTYALAATDSDDAETIDPMDTLCWRHAPRRLDAECLRDAMLMSSGQLDLKAPIGSMVANAGDGAIGAGPQYMRINENLFINATGTYRSVYLPAIRDLEPDAMGLFDYPDSNTINGQRESTNVPTQALYLINNPFVRNQARLLAQRVTAAAQGGINQPRVIQTRVTFAFQTVFGRAPTTAELAASSDFLTRMRNDDGMAPAETWTDFCLGLYNTAEFRFLK